MSRKQIELLSQENRGNTNWNTSCFLILYFAAALRFWLSIQKTNKPINKQVLLMVKLPKHLELWVFVFCFFFNFSSIFHNQQEIVTQTFIHNFRLTVSSLLIGRRWPEVTCMCWASRWNQSHVTCFQPDGHCELQWSSVSSTSSIQSPTTSQTQKRVIA